MAETSVKTTCGKTTVEYDKRCAYTCSCLPNSGCNWTVSCPDGSGGWIYTSGTGLIATPPRRPTMTISGKLEAVARCLERQWKRHVIVPPELSKKTIRNRTLQGTPEEIAHILGLQLGSKRTT